MKGLTFVLFGILSLIFGLIKLRIPNKTKLGPLQTKWNWIGTRPIERFWWLYRNSNSVNYVSVEWQASDR